MALILRIALPTPLYQCFDYLPPEGLDLSTPPKPGVRIKVPFGRRQLIGILMECPERSSLPIDQLRQAIDILDQTPLLPTAILTLCQWASRYYYYPIGEVVVGTLPKWIRQGKPMAVKEQEKGLDPIMRAQTPFDLNTHQQQAVDAINQAASFQPFLLEGVTGSGKTEVYLQTIEQCLIKKQQALVLIPEIALTPQTVTRFEERFQEPIAVLHSGLTDKQRGIAWWRAKIGEARIVIGTRSAIFVPMPALGLIILDEEHDTSFKQQSGFRYSARDCAVMRAQMEHIPVVLGSATPSLESLYNVERERYIRLPLPERVGGGVLPKVHVLNIRDQRLDAGISTQLLKTIQAHLENQGQVIIFLNRRGYSPVLLCHHCGWMSECDRCDVRMVYHQNTNRLRCHHCEAQRPVPRECPECESSELIKCGQGTQKIEAYLKEQFPDKNILRIDRDTTRKKGRLADMLSEVVDHNAHILIGTQMLAKGHHFPHLTLVAVVDLDGGFFSADFRAVERMGQLIVQVAGRAGRENKSGEVAIQTHHPDHPLLVTLLKEGYDAFAKAVLAERQAAQLPPCAYQARLHAESTHQSKPFEFLETIATRLQKEPLELLGPMASTLQKKAGKYQAELILQSTKRPQLHQSLGALMDYLSESKSHVVRWVLEVDP